MSMIISCSSNINSIDDAKNAMKEKYPNIKIDSIEQVNNSFFEIIIQDQLYYLTSDFKHLIVGNVIDFETGDSFDNYIVSSSTLKQSGSGLTSATTFSAISFDQGDKIQIYHMW